MWGGGGLGESPEAFMLGAVNKTSGNGMTSMRLPIEKRVGYLVRPLQPPECLVPKVDGGQRICPIANPAAHSNMQRSCSTPGLVTIGCFVGGVVDGQSQCTRLRARDERRRMVGPLPEPNEESGTIDDHGRCETNIPHKRSSQTSKHHSPLQGYYSGGETVTG